MVMYSKHCRSTSEEDEEEKKKKICWTRSG